MTAPEPVGEAKLGSPEMPEWLSSLKNDAGVLTLVSETVSESGDFHLRVVFWGVLLKVVQKFQNALLMAGIPSILVIGFNYEPWFNTTQDTLDKCSASTLDAVGQTLVTYLFQSN